MQQKRRKMTFQVKNAINAPIKKKKKVYLFETYLSLGQKFCVKKDCKRIEIRALVISNNTIFVVKRS